MRSLPALLRRTRGTIIAERAYAAFVPALAFAAGFVGVALMGLFDVLPPVPHGLLLLAAAAILLALFGRGLSQFRLPTRAEAVARLEGDAGLRRGVLRDLQDRPFDGDAADPLWQAHLARLAREVRDIRTGRPRALIDRTDPWQLRVVGALALVTGLLLAGDDAQRRLASTFSPGVGGDGSVIADIWIEAPAYTELPPRFLVRGTELPEATAEALSVPDGATLHLRLTAATGDGSPRARATLATEDGQQAIELTEGAARAASLTLDRNAALSIAAGGRRAIWPIEVVPDRAPQIRWHEDPAVEGGTRTVLSVDIDDDYGVAEAWAIVALSEDLERAPDAPTPEPGAAAALEVPVPALRGAPGIRTVAIDLTEHPFAGLPVQISLRIEDGAGAVAQSAPKAFTLPARNFYNPLSRTVIEQRQNLALAPRSWRRTARMFDALTFAPDRFAKDAEEYLLLRTAYHEVYNGAGENVPELVDSLWPLAVALEDEGLTLARQRLEAAQEALREALARNAPQEEIDRLVEELRTAMNDYIAALAASGDAEAMASSEGGATLDGRDLDDILDEIAELRRQGDSAEARARLAELERLLQNLRITSAAAGEGEGQQDGEGGEQAGNRPGEQVGSLIDQQRRLSDDTFATRRGEQDGTDLSQRQQALADAARELSDQAARQDTEGEGPASAPSFEQAENAMRQSARALARGDLATAQAAQEEAIQALQQGGEALAEQALAERGEGEGEGRQGDGGSMSGPAADRDPLGRRYGSSGRTGIDIPEIGDPERIRTLTEEVRRRLSDPGLDPEERSYLERLLERF
jgi:uncharacterized protein (TIGR02302 family)